MDTHLTVRGRGLIALAAACTISIIGAAFAPAQSRGAAAHSAAPKGALSLAGAGQSQTVRYGAPVRLSGSVTPGGRKAVRLEHAASGHRFRPVASATTAADGSYRFTVRPRRSGAFRTVMQSGAPASGVKRVIVVARLAGRSKRHVLGAKSVRVRGRLLPRVRGRRVRLQLRTRHGWRTVDRTRTRGGGRFRASVRPTRPGIYRLRVRFPGDGVAAATSDLLPRLYVYRAGNASWYGPGLWGNSTACGGSLTAGRVGVANKSLPCGTRVTFRYRGRSLTVPVIDRGPFEAGREWDLTAAAKHRLGFGNVGVVWSTR